MTTDAAGSVTHWVGDLKSGGQEAAARLWGRYFECLCTSPGTDFAMPPEGGPTRKMWP
jgi:hypothetical protein